MWANVKRIKKKVGDILIYTDNKDFYPTPRPLFDRLTNSIRHLDGNIHIWFKDENLLEQLNYICGQHFAWIPSEEEQKVSPKAREWVAKEFGSVGKIRLLETIR